MLRAFALCAALAAPMLSPPAHAEVYKCTRGGRVEYSNSPCSKDAKPHQLKGNVTVINSEALTGKAKESKAEGAGKGPTSILGIKPLDPIGDCKRKGGEFDKEFRACRMP
jgi:hypothetical protein